MLYKLLCSVKKWPKSDVQPKKWTFLGVVYHNTYSSAINAIEDYANSKGFELDQEEYGSAYVDAFFKPKEGSTKKDTLTLFKNGKEQRNALHIQIYGRQNKKFELNMYIN